VTVSGVSMDGTRTATGPLAAMGSAGCSETRAAETGSMASSAPRPVQDQMQASSCIIHAVGYLDRN
jgi:hypothetical protein